MRNVLALVLAGGRVDELSVLTLSRPKSALPFGGMYRVIDFCLSNLMHSGVEKVGILSQYQSYSLINHIGIGASWDFVGRDRGATLLLPSIGHKIRDWYKGTADSVYQNLEFVREHDVETIMVLSGDHVYKMDYTPMLEYHMEKDADLTLAFAKIDPAYCKRFGMGKIADGDNRGGELLAYAEKPDDTPYEWASLTIYLFKPHVLDEVVTANAKTNSYEFGRDVIPEMCGKYRIYGYKFYDYWAYTRTVDEFWLANMGLLGPDRRIDLQQWQVRTNLDHDGLRDRPPARVGSAAVIENSMVHNGCVVDGQVKNSILFPGVKVAKGAQVEDSILFFDTIIEHEVSLNKVITDFDVRVEKKCAIGVTGENTPNEMYPKLLNSGITLLGKGTHVPAGVQLGKNCIVAPSLPVEKFSSRRYESGETVV